MDFRSLKTKLAANFQLATQDKPLFEVAADPDKLWEIYLSPLFEFLGRPYFGENFL